MVDNFELIEQYMAKQALTWKEGDCYYVQLLRRQADDPMIGGVKDKKYHGNMHSRSIKDYLIKSVDHLEDVKQQIIEFCKLENVRAYIRLNKRNYKNIALQMMKHIAEQAASGETYSSPFHLVSSAFISYFTGTEEPPVVSKQSSTISSLVKNFKNSFAIPFALAYEGI